MALEDAELLIRTFQVVLGTAGARFGTPATGTPGIHDGNAGVQWNAYLDLARQQPYLGVNLEGMQYDGWPIARLIQAELEAPLLPELCRGVPRSAQIEVHWWRDCWLAAGRVKIHEHQISPTPFRLDRLTPAAWRQALETALGCLNPERRYRGRAQQTVTLAQSGQLVLRWVSPHLQFRMRLSSCALGNQKELAAEMAAAKAVLEPMFGFVQRRCQVDRRATCCG